MIRRPAEKVKWLQRIIERIVGDNVIQKGGWCNFSSLFAGSTAILLDSDKQVPMKNADIQPIVEWTIDSFSGPFPMSGDAHTGLLEKFTGTRSLQRNEFFLREGEYCNKIAFIKSGMIRHFYNSRDGEVTRWVSLDNTLCTSLSGFIRDVRSKENLQACVAAPHGAAPALHRHGDHEC